MIELKHLKNPGEQNVKTTGSWLELQEIGAKVASERNQCGEFLTCAGGEPLHRRKSLARCLWFAPVKETKIAQVARSLVCAGKYSNADRWNGG